MVVQLEDYVKFYWAVYFTVRDNYFPNDSWRTLFKDRSPDMWTSEVIGKNRALGRELFGRAARQIYLNLTYFSERKTSVLSVDDNFLILAFNIIDCKILKEDRLLRKLTDPDLSVAQFELFRNNYSKYIAQFPQLVSVVAKNYKELVYKVFQEPNNNVLEKKKLLPSHDMGNDDFDSDNLKKISDEFNDDLSQTYNRCINVVDNSNLQNQQKYTAVVVLENEKIKSELVQQESHISEFVKNKIVDLSFGKPINWYQFDYPLSLYALGRPNDLLKLVGFASSIKKSKFSVSEFKTFGISIRIDDYLDIYVDLFIFYTVIVSDASKRHGSQEESFNKLLKVQLTAERINDEKYKFLLYSMLQPNIRLEDELLKDDLFNLDF